MQLLEIFTSTKSSIKSESCSFLWRREKELILLLCTAHEWEPGFVGKYPCQVCRVRCNAASKLSPVWPRKLKVHLCITVCRCCLIRGTCAADGRTPALIPLNNWRLVKKKKSGGGILFKIRVQLMNRSLWEVQIAACVEGEWSCFGSDNFHSHRGQASAAAGVWKSKTCWPQTSCFLENSSKTKSRPF